MGLAPIRLKPDKYISFFSSYKKASPVLVTDYDGTLAPFVKDREKAFLTPKTRSLLKLINEAGGEVIIVSGRRPEEILDFVGLPLEIWGSHGMEKIDKNGRYYRGKVPEEELKKLDDFSSQLAYFPRGSVEKKPSGIALHWRDRAEVFNMFTEVSEKLISEASEHSLKVVPFNGGMEFVLPYFTKGTTINQISVRFPEATPICYLGDDTTDEDAFREIQNIKSGVGILVSDDQKVSAANVYIYRSEVDIFLDFWLNEQTPKGEGNDAGK
ncbi:MAG: trehalose-phosphatase [Synergistaceae bacterium]|jgi:trehalose-phosphatase|nr:trehalose-phosphatase [Synergistaceae bacterium]MDD4838581.1 trehalose-phosphatase [Synergistaceae bacterium]